MSEFFANTVVQSVALFGGLAVVCGVLFWLASKLGSERPEIPYTVDNTSIPVGDEGSGGA